MEMPIQSCSRSRVTCSNCVLREMCLPAGMSRNELESAEQLVSTRLRIRRGSSLYRSGDAFKSLYVVWLGSLKSSVTSEDAREQVTGFHMAGDMVGFDGMGTGDHACDVVALEDTEVCVFPYSRIEEVAETMPTLRRHFYKLMSCEIVRKHSSMLMLGSMQADERLATFLLDLADRFERRGYSSREFVLRMTRAEIGSYLGLTLETVSRVMSQFTRDGLIGLSSVKQVRIADPARLRRLAVGRDAVKGEARPVRVPEAAPRAVVRPPVTRVVRELVEEFV